MNSQKLLIISLIAAVLIIGGAVVLVKSRSTPVPGTTSTQPGSVVVDEIMASCKPNDKCIVVDTTCSFCGEYVAINAKSEILFNEMLDQVCKNYSGSYCNDNDLSSYPACVNGTCQMVKWSEKQPSRAPAPTATVTTIPAPAPATTPAPIAAPPAATPTTPATAAPATTPIPAPAPQPVVPQPAVKAFGEDDAATAVPAPADDLYAPLPEKLTPLETLDDHGVEVIQP